MSIFRRKKNKQVVKPPVIAIKALNTRNKNLNLNKLTQTLYKEFGLPKAQCKRIITYLFKEIANTITKGQKATFHDLGTFTKVTRKVKQVRHPKTNKIITTPEYKTIKFTPSKKLKEKL